MFSQDILSERRISMNSEYMMNTNQKILFALPYAGGTSMSFMSWDWPEEIEFRALEYPGHGLRHKEPLPDTIQEMGADAAAHMLKYTDNGRKPFSIFAHSMGAIVGWYAIRQLQKQGIRPEAYFVSCMRVPEHFTIHDGIWLDTEEKVMEYLRDEARISDRVMNSKSFKTRFFPPIKHDFFMFGTYEYTDDGSPVSFPIHTYSASQDNLCDPQMVKDWQTLTTGAFTNRMFEGSHFYFEDKVLREELISDIAGKILSLT